MVGSRDMQPSTAPFFPNVFIHNQFRAKPQLPPPTMTLAEKVAIITGGSAGLGQEAARQLLSLKLGHLILTARSAEKGEAVAAQFRSTFPKANIEVWILDLASYESIQAFAKRVDAELSRLDVVILNAGVRKFSFSKVSGTGHEEVMQINYLSTVLLAILLLPSLKSKSPAASPGRMTISNAALSLASKFTNENEDPFLEWFDDPKNFDAIERYNCSKLLAHMFLWKLVDCVSADDVIVNLVDPGFVKGTDLSRDARGGVKAGVAVFGAIAGRTKKDGASTYLDAVLNKGKDSHGTFLMGWQIHPFAGVLYQPGGKTATERLWKETLDEFDFANARGVLDSLKQN